MSRRNSGFLCGCIVAVGLAAAPAQAAAVWTATFEKGDSSEWMPGINAKGPDGARLNFQVLTEQVYRGKYAGKITVHPDDLYGQYKQDRVDIQHQSTLTGEGQNSWLSGHYMMPEDAKVRNQIAFYESNVSYQNMMDFWVEPKAGGGTTINFGTGFLGEKKLWTGDFTKGVWHQVAIHVLWSTNAQTGTVDVWFDGQQVVTGAKAKTKADANTLFFQTGLHRRDPANFDDTIYLDDFIEADNQIDAKIAAPSADPVPGGGAGGTGGMAGAAGAAGASTAGAGGSGSSLGGAGGTAPSGDSTSSSAGAGGSTSTPTAGTTSTAGTTTAPAAAEDTGSCSLGKPATGRGVATLGGLLALGALLVARRRR